MLSQKRIAPRRNASFDAIIAFSRTRMACIIRNVIDGAKLEVLVKGITGAFDLSCPVDRPQRCASHGARLKEIGVAFAAWRARPERHHAQSTWNTSSIPAHHSPAVLVASGACIGMQISHHSCVRLSSAIFAMSASWSVPWYS